MDRYAVAVTMTEDRPGCINICTFLKDYSSTSQDEAVGRAVLEAMERNPKHQVFSTLARKIEPILASEPHP